ELIHMTRFSSQKQIADLMENIAKDSNPLNVYRYLIKTPIILHSIIKWIPFSQITNLQQIAEGGFGMVYKAKYLGVMPKVKDNSGSYFEYINETVAIKRLETIHNKELIHRDVHSGNILFVEQNDYRYQWQIGDLGLSQPANNTSLNNEIYWVIPYIAPEIFNGAPFSKKSDIYKYISKEYEFDMDTRRLLTINAQPLNAITTPNSSKKRKNKEIEAKTQNYQKQIKTSRESKHSLNFVLN
ncbi:3991_t:CDS:2, partial [Funneliformis geosporum]